MRKLTYYLRERRKHKQNGNKGLVNLLEIIINQSKKKA